MIDINICNICFTSSRLPHLNKADLFKVLGKPEVEAFARLHGKPLGDNFPKQLVESACWEDWIDEDEEDIRLLDFGGTFLQGSEPRRLAWPGAIRAPEMIFVDEIDCRIDLWCAGIAVRTFHAEQI